MKGLRKIRDDDLDIDCSLNNRKKREQKMNTYAFWNETEKMIKEQIKIKKEKKNEKL